MSGRESSESADWAKDTKDELDAIITKANEVPQTSATTGHPDILIYPRAIWHFNDKGRFVGASYPTQTINHLSSQSDFRAPDSVLPVSPPTQSLDIRKCFSEGETGTIDSVLQGQNPDSTKRDFLTGIKALLEDHTFGEVKSMARKRVLDGTAKTCGSATQRNPTLSSSVALVTEAQLKEYNTLQETKNSNEGMESILRQSVITPLSHRKVEYVYRKAGDDTANGSSGKPSGSTLEAYYKDIGGGQSTEDFSGSNRDSISGGADSRALFQEQLPAPETLGAYFDRKFKEADDADELLM